MSTPDPLDAADLAQRFRVVAERVTCTHDLDAALAEVVYLAHHTIPFCDWAGITEAVAAGSRFNTLAVTDPVVQVADDIQYRLRQGPCVDAASTGGLFRADDLRAPNPWPRFSAEVVDRTPIRSLLSITINSHPRRAALNLYSGSVDVFTPEAVDIASVFAAHAQVLLLLARQSGAVANLNRALDTSRLIGSAVGIMMYAHRITADQAFDRLRTASSHLNRKLSDVAGQVTDTGSLPDPTDRDTWS